MPLDPLDPTHLALSPEQRVADKFATLDRRIGVAERSSSNIIARNRVYGEQLAEVSTGSTTYVDLGGPSVTITVPTGGFVEIMCEAEGHSSDNLGSPSAEVGISIAGLGTADALSSGAQLAYVRKRSVPGDAGGTSGDLGGRIVIPLPSAGSYTIGLQYKRSTGTTETVFFRNRRLWVEVT